MLTQFQILTQVDPIDRTLGHIYLEHADHDLAAAVGALRQASHCSDPVVADAATLARTLVAEALRILRGHA